MDDVWKATLEREAYLRDQGYELRVIWECELASQLRSNKDMKSFFDKRKELEPMNPRQALFGGRTGALRMLNTTDVQIGYVDIISLYPFICKYSEFPIKHPVIYTENFKDLNDKPYFGVIKCRILAPRKLYHPILPHRVDKKLFFALCRTCADTTNQSTCDHSDDERALTGVWCTPEIYKVI